MEKRAVVTGGAGFIGSALCLELVNTGWAVTVLDALTYAAAPGTLDALTTAGVHTSQGDVRDREAVRACLERARPGVVFHLAAETHVDRSIDAASDFISTNVNGTFEVLEALRAHRDSRSDTGADPLCMVHVSTDEVFGALGPDEPPFCETTRYDPSSPYSASKAASDHLARAWARTYGLDIRVSNCSNNYGPRQFPEKLIPLMILNALEGRALPVYGDGSNRRDWLHVEDHARALRRIAEIGAPGQTYCIGGGAEHSNLEVVELICAALDERAPAETTYRDLITFVTDRPGHDWRYAIDSQRAAAELDWRASHSFETGLGETIAWYLDNTSWWDGLSGRYGRERLGRI
jgi:dTDP-glucose 4,6-dehydratase